MKLPRRRFLYLTAGAAALPSVSHVAGAQTYPSRPVTLIVFVPAGGTPDIIARLVGQTLSQRLSQSVVIDNRPGGGGNLALQAVANWSGNPVFSIKEIRRDSCSSTRSEPIDIPEAIPNPVVLPKPTPTPTEPAPKEPVRIPEKVP